MIPVDKIRNDVNLDNLLRFIDWKNSGSEAPPGEDLETIGQLVMEDVISSSNCKLGDVFVEFNVDHKGNRDIPESVKKDFYFGVPGDEDDFLNLEATFRWNPDGPGTPVRELRGIPIYSGSSFREMWAVWKSWMMAGESIMADLNEYIEEKIRNKKEEAERNGTGCNAGQE